MSEVLRGYFTVLCVLFDESTGNKLQYKPQDILGYGYDQGKKYISRTFQDEETEKNLFLELLIDGKIDLYRYYDQQSAEIFVIANKENAFRIHSVQYVHRDNIGQFRSSIGTLRILFNDCPSLKSSLENTKNLPRKLLISFIKKYHQCMMCEYQDYTLENMQKNPVCFSFMVGGHFYHLLTYKNFPDLQEDYPFRSFSYKAGGRITWQTPIHQISGAFNINFLNYNDLSTTNYQNLRKTSYVFNIYEIEFSMISLNANIIYTPFQQRKFRPYLFAGPYAGKIFGIQTGMQERRYIEPDYVLNLDFLEPENIPDKSYGICGGAGISIVLSDKLTAFFEGVFNRAFVMPPLRHYMLTQGIEFHTGITFR